MKIYNKKKENNKSWSVILQENNGNIILSAVDSESGEWIAYLITFRADGTVVMEVGAHENFYDHEYDPFEHGNSFDEDGRIEIINENSELDAWFERLSHEQREKAKEDLKRQRASMIRLERWTEVDNIDFLLRRL